MQQIFDPQQVVEPRGHRRTQRVRRQLPVPYSKVVPQERARELRKRRRIGIVDAISGDESLKVGILERERRVVWPSLLIWVAWMVASGVLRRTGSIGHGLSLFHALWSLSPPRPPPSPGYICADPKNALMPFCTFGLSDVTSSPKAP